MFYLEIAYQCHEPDRFDFVRSGEGPWEIQEDALAFARNECGTSWQIVNEQGETVETGNEDVPPLPAPSCPECGSSDTEPGGGEFWCNACGTEWCP